VSVVRIFLSCIPPKTSHHAKKIMVFGSGDRRFTALGDTKELKEAKASLTDLLLPFQIPQPIPAPVIIAVDYIWPWRTADSRKFRAPGRQPHTVRPDISNVYKTLEDRLVELKFIADDGGVAETRLRKWWGDNPGIEIAIAPMAERSAVVPEQQDFFSLEDVNAAHVE
jgi:Holliday junction resolvase RusA-like endonuclease